MKKIQYNGRKCLKVVSLILRLKFLNVVTNEISTLHLTICTWIVLENYNNNDQQLNRHFVVTLKIYGMHWVCLK